MTSMSERDRFFLINDSLNFRHMGGYTAADGRKTRADRLFRTGRFELDNQPDIDRFEALGIDQIFDFRSASERRNRPLQLLASVLPEIVELDISSGNIVPYITRLMREQPAHVDCKSEMTRMYYEMLDEALPRFQALFEYLFNCDGAVMMLCSTGKDRSGVAAALILAALGVAKTVIFEDYMLSARAYRDHEAQTFAKSFGVSSLLLDPELVRDVFTVHPEYLEALWKKAEEMGGTIDSFLEQCLGLNESALKDLRARFTE
jgi:protein-tyrosine phosphatase